MREDIKSANNEIPQDAVSMNDTLTDVHKSLYVLENVVQQYQNRQVLRIEHLEIFKGEILTLVGPSGAGKSTLLRLLNFLEPPRHGRILFRNIEFRAGKEMPLELRRKVTMVFQQPLLLGGSVRSNVQYGLSLRGQRDGNELVNSTLEEVGLRAFANQRANTLSGGEAQRVSLARAMVLKPDVLLMDEPTANLDPHNVCLIEKIIQDLNLIHGTTIVMVTHNVFQAKRLANRVVLLLDGKLIESGTAHEFFNQPSDPRTDAFIRGEMIY